MKDNPNPRASIGLICRHPFFYFVYKSLYQHLLPYAEIIVESYDMTDQKTYPEEEKQKFRDLLISEGVFWREFDKDGDYSEGEFFLKYHTLVGCLHYGLIARPCNKDKYKVRIFYGVAKNLWMYGLQNVHFDLICTPGEFYQKKLLSLYGGDIEITGEPKFDVDYKLTKEECRLKIGLPESTKKTVLIGMTWGSLSSLEQFLPHLMKLAQNYDVIIKVHHMTSVFEPELLEVLREVPVMVIDQYVPVITALRAADVVISENSGLVFDAVQVGIPLVLLDTIGPHNEKFFTERPFYGVSGSNKLLGTSSSAGSDEQQIKDPKVRFAPVVPLYQRVGFHAHHAALVRAIEDADKQEYRQNQEQFRSSRFVSMDGGAGARIASLIKQRRIETRTPTPAKRFLAELLDDYDDNLRKGHSDEVKKTIAHYVSLYGEYATLKYLPFRQRWQKIVDLLSH